MVLLDPSENLTDIDSNGGSIAITHSETNRLIAPNTRQHSQGILEETIECANKKDFH
jgi:hypothetical protein